MRNDGDEPRRSWPFPRPGCSLRATAATLTSIGPRAHPPLRKWTPTGRP